MGSRQNKIMGEKQTQSSMNYDRRVEMPYADEALRAAQESARKNRRIAVTAVSLLCAFALIATGFVVYFLMSDDDAKGGGSASSGSGGEHIGEYITFGKYEQDNNKSNGKEDIEWLVIDEKDGKALVISKYVLDCNSFSDDADENRWEKSSVRRWLNNDFVSEAFSNEEMTKISAVTVPAHDNPQYDVDCGNSTKDMLFFLSIDEVNEYFPSAEERMCEPTAYADEVGRIFLDSGDCSWVLRTSGRNSGFVSYVMGHGVIDYSGMNVTGFSHGIRPAMWIEIETKE